MDTAITDTTTSPATDVADTATPSVPSPAAPASPTVTELPAPTDRGPATWETLSADGLEDQLRQLVHEGTARRVVVRQQGEVVADFPLAAGVLGTLLAARVAGIAVLVALLADCTIQVERTEPAPAAPGVDPADVGTG